MEKETRFLIGVREVNPDWAKETARYANGLMDKVAETFTIMAGRCYRAAFILGELGETGDADNLSGLVCLDTIGAILANFHRFNEDYRAGKQNDVQIALKTGQITARLESVYKAGQLNQIIGPHLVKRAERLLTDYLIIFRGFLPMVEREEFDLADLVRDCIDLLVSPPCSDEELITLADDDARYRQALVKRLVYIPVFEDDSVLFDLSDDPSHVVADKERLKD